MSDREKLRRQLQSMSLRPDGQAHVQQMWVDRFVNLNAGGSELLKSITHQQMIQQIVDHDFPEQPSSDQ